MFVVLESKNLNPTQGFEDVKRYAGLAAGKPRGCSEHVFILYIYYVYIILLFHGISVRPNPPSQHHESKSLFTLLMLVLKVRGAIGLVQVKVLWDPMGSSVLLR